MGAGIGLAYILDYLTHKRTTPHFTGVISSGKLVSRGAVEAIPRLCV